MSFDERYEAPTDYRSNPYTQDISKSVDNKSYQQSPLLRVDHEDPGLHFIGESLPKPGDTEATWSGRETSVGTSPIPARADHSHDTFLRYGVYAESTVAQICPPGNTLLGLDYFRGDNYLVSGTLLSLPQEGVWNFNVTLYITRAGGGNFTGEINLVYFYLNGGFGRTVHRNGVAGIPTDYAINASDYAHYDASSIGVNATVELSYQHNDVVNHNVLLSQFTVTRLASL